MWAQVAFTWTYPFLVVIWTLTVKCSSLPTPAHPHIIFILADDLGWNDVSFHGSDQIPTPNIDSLAYNGVILNKHYVQPLCTPSRACLMTGKYSIHTGLHTPISSSGKAGLPETEKLLPQYLKEIGYATHIVGKWHLGFYKKQMTPMARGFDSHFGYWSGAISYYDHIFDETSFQKVGFWGHDMKRNYSSAWDVVGQYATDLFTNEAVQVIENHPQNKPLFLYLAHLATHAGNKGKWLEAPQQDINHFSYISNPNRRTYAAMLSKLDQSVGEVIGALAKRNLLENSIIVFTSDNGAPNTGVFNNWGSNYPFRGDKGTLWEGATRVPAVVWSPMIAKPSRVSWGLMHISDWLPTLLSAIGYNLKGRVTSIDGLDQWQAISNDHPSPRETFVMDIFETGKMYGIYSGSFKYIKGATFYPYNIEKTKYLNLDSIFSKDQPKYNLDNIFNSKAWIALQNITESSDLQHKVDYLRQKATIFCPLQRYNEVQCDYETPCLFNINSDPCEQFNIAKDFPVLTSHLEKLLNSYKHGSCPEQIDTYNPEANPENFNGTWNYWKID